MNPRLFYESCALCVILLVSLSLTQEHSGVSKSSRRRRCRCKKYITQLNLDINKRLNDFEAKFEQYFTTSMDDITNKTQTAISDINDRAINSVSHDFNSTSQLLRLENYSLKRLQQTMRSQKVTVETLNSNFKELDAIVRNLSVVVERLEETMKNTIDLTNSRVSRRERKRKQKEPEPPVYPKDCDEVYQSGGMKYLGDYFLMIKPERSSTPFKTVCKIVNGAGYTVIQRRQDGRENFSRDWEDYKNGFGDQQKDFWLGNENIHHITTQGDYSLKIDMEDWEGNTYYAEYDRFRVSGEKDNYRLHVSGYHGTAGDALTGYKTHDGIQFSTRDKDHDEHYYIQCAEEYSGGWWFNDCFESHLNGKYYDYGQHTNFFQRDGLMWNTIHSYSSLKFVEMMVKPAAKAKLPNDI